MCLIRYHLPLPVINALDLTKTNPQQSHRKSKQELQTKMDEVLGSIKALCASINSMEFSSPGIFTNAMITRPELTTLIRDALPAEQQLYKITSSVTHTGVTGCNKNFNKSLQSRTSMHETFIDLQPERIDGKAVMGMNTPVRERKTAVISPVVIAESPRLTDTMSLPTKRKIASQYSLIPRQAIESDDPIVMCDAILAIAQNNPAIKGITHSKQRALMLKTEYESLTKEIESFGESLLTDAKGKDMIYNLLTHDMNELIAKEQAEIDRLESQLELG